MPMRRIGTIGTPQCCSHFNSRPPFGSPSRLPFRVNFCPNRMSAQCPLLSEADALAQQPERMRHLSRQRGVTGHHLQNVLRSYLGEFGELSQVIHEVARGE